MTDEAGEPLLDYDGTSGAVRQWMVRDGGALGTVAQVNPAAGQRTTFIPDLQGSIIASLDAGSGSLVKAGYVPYGQPSAALPFGYTGLRTDAETGLTNNHARLYHPALGRFIQNDPAGYAGGQNLYAYVSNDPLNGTDRNGLVADAASAGIDYAVNNPGQVAAAGLIGAGITACTLSPCAAVELAVVGGAATVGGGITAAGIVAGESVTAGLGVLGGTILLNQNQSNSGNGGTKNDKESGGVNTGNLKEASMNDLRSAAKSDGYSSVESWKQQELSLTSRDQIYKDREGNLYSLPRRGGGTPQPLNIKVP